MRVAAIYDIHGNLPALEAALEAIRQSDVDLIVVGGDVVPGPMPAQTIAMLQTCEIPRQFIMGNTDREVIAQMDGVTTEWFETAVEERRAPVRWTAQQLTVEHRHIMARWPRTFAMTHEHLGNLIFCHATPRNDTDIFTRRTPAEKLLPLFSPFADSTVICGHTHMQFDRMVGATHVVNAGSVGMPFGDTGAYWLLLGTEIQLRCTAYNLEEACRQIAATDFPNAGEFAKDQIALPPDEQMMLEIFGRAELSP